MGHKCYRNFLNMHKHNRQKWWQKLSGRDMKADVCTGEALRAQQFHQRLTILVPTRVVIFLCGLIYFWWHILISSFIHLLWQVIIHMQRKILFMEVPPWLLSNSAGSHFPSNTVQLCISIKFCQIVLI